MQVVHLWRPQIFHQHVCVLKVSVHMTHFSVIGTEKVGRMINRLPDYAEYLLSDSNMGKKKKKNHCEGPSGNGNIDILSLVLPASILISSEL